MSDWNDDGFDAAVEKLLQRRETPQPKPRGEAPVNPGPCNARCCKTPYGHAQAVKFCLCHPVGSVR